MAGCVELWPVAATYLNVGVLLPRSLWCCSSADPVCDHSNYLQLPRNEYSAVGQQLCVSCEHVDPTLQGPSWLKSGVDLTCSSAGSTCTINSTSKTLCFNPVQMDDLDKVYTCVYLIDFVRRCRIDFNISRGGQLYVCVSSHACVHALYIYTLNSRWGWGLVPVSLACCFVVVKVSQPTTVWVFLPHMAGCMCDSLAAEEVGSDHVRGTGACNCARVCPLP